MRMWQMRKRSPLPTVSGSLGKLREFVHAPCGKMSYPGLAIESGLKRTDINSNITFYSRQCSRAPLPHAACLHQLKPKEECKEYGNCDKCGWEVTMPACAIEYCDIADADWREFRPHIETTG